MNTNSYLGQDILLKVFDKVDLKTKINMMATIGKGQEKLREQMQTEINTELYDLLDMLKVLITPCITENTKQYHCKIAGNTKWPLFYILSEIDVNPDSFNGISEGQPEGQQIPILPTDMKQVLTTVKDLSERMKTLLTNTSSDQPRELVKKQADNLSTLISEIEKIKGRLGTAGGGKKKRLDSLTVKELQAKVKSKGIQGYSKMNKAQLIGALRSRRST